MQHFGLILKLQFVGLFLNVSAKELLDSISVLMMRVAHSDLGLKAQTCRSNSCCEQSRRQESIHSFVNMPTISSFSLELWRSSGVCLRWSPSLLLNLTNVTINSVGSLKVIYGCHLAILTLPFNEYRLFLLQTIFQDRVVVVVDPVQPCLSGMS